MASPFPAVSNPTIQPVEPQNAPNKLFVFFNRSAKFNPAPLSSLQVPKTPAQSLGVFYPIYPFRVSPDMYRQLVILINSCEEVFLCSFSLDESFRPEMMVKILSQLDPNVISLDKESEVLQAYESGTLHEKLTDLRPCEKTLAAKELLEISKNHTSFYFLEEEVLEDFVKSEIEKINESSAESVVSKLAEMIEKKEINFLFPLDAKEAERLEVIESLSIFSRKELTIEAFKHTILALVYKAHLSIVEISNKATDSIGNLSLGYIEKQMKEELDGVEKLIDKVSDFVEIFDEPFKNHPEVVASTGKISSMRKLLELMRKYNSDALRVLENSKQNFLYMISTACCDEEIKLTTERESLTFGASCEISTLQSGKSVKFALRFKPFFKINNFFVHTMTEKVPASVKINGNYLCSYRGMVNKQRIDSTQFNQDMTTNVVKTNTRMIYSSVSPLLVSMVKNFVEFVKQEEENLIEVEIIAYAKTSFKLLFCMYPEGVIA